MVPRDYCRSTLYMYNYCIRLGASSTKEPRESLCQKDVLRIVDLVGSIRYNNDHFISHCAFEYFPRVLTQEGYKFAYSMYMPDFVAKIERPILFHYNQDRTSAKEEIERLQFGQGSRWRTKIGPGGKEPILAFHHATSADMAHLRELNL